MDRPYDPDRLDRGPVYAHRASRSVGSGTLPRLTAAVTSLRAATEIWIRRGSLGPLPDRRAGDPFGQGR